MSEQYSIADSNEEYKILDDHDDEDELVADFEVLSDESDSDLSVDSETGQVIDYNAFYIPRKQL